jgi:hypothetical protein
MYEEEKTEVPDISGEEEEEEIVEVDNTPAEGLSPEGI